MSKIIIYGDNAIIEDGSKKYKLVKNNSQLASILTQESIVNNISSKQIALIGELKIAKAAQRNNEDRNTYLKSSVKKGIMFAVCVEIASIAGIAIAAPMAAIGTLLFALVLDAFALYLSKEDNTVYNERKRLLKQREQEINAKIEFYEEELIKAKEKLKELGDLDIINDEIEVIKIDASSYMYKLSEQATSYANDKTIKVKGPIKK